MKKISLLLTTLLMTLLMVSCGKDYAVEFEYIPVQLDRDNERWTLMDPDGKTLKDDFKGRPSPVVNGVFYVYKNNKGTYDLYKVSGDRAKEIDGMSDLYDVEGYYTEGVIAVRKKDGGKIEFVDDDGKTKFSLSKDFHVSGFFSDGMMKVWKSEEDSYESKYGFINTKGETVIKLKYDYVTDFVDGIAAVRADDKWIIIDKEGKTVTTMKGVTDVNQCLVGDYFVVEKDGVYGLMNKKGEFKKCKYRIRGFNGKYLIVSDDGDYGVYDIDGNKIIPTKYDNIQFIGKNFLCSIKDDEKFVARDADDEELYTISEEGALSLIGNDPLIGGDFLLAGGDKRIDLFNPKNGKVIEGSRMENVRF